MTTEFRGLLFRPPAYTDDMRQMMDDLGIEPSQIGIDYSARPSWSAFGIVLRNGDTLIFSPELCLA